MRWYTCFADDCSFGTGIRTEYVQHVFEVHTENREGVDRHRTVRRILSEQGIEEERS